MKVIICGAVVPEKLEKKLPAASPAGSKYMRNMAKAFQNAGYKVVYAAYIALPGAQKVFTGTYCDDSYHYILKDRYIIPSVIQYQKMVVDLADSGDIVLFYNVDYSRWGLLQKLKERNVKSLLILADHTKSYEYRNIIRKMMAIHDETEIKTFDYAILLSENAREFISSKCRYEIMEGGINYNDYKDIPAPAERDEKVFMYAGTLGYVTGVDQMIDAFRKMPNMKIKLIICGKGELEDMVKKAALEDARIDYKGYVSNEEYIQELSKADVLINPRNMEMLQNQYNFPSKILEYLASGRMIISTRFPGWERFTKYIFFYDNGVNQLIDSIGNNLDYRMTIKEQYTVNRNFAKSFDWSCQLLKMLILVNGNE